VRSGRTDLGFDPFTKVEHSTTNFWGARPLLCHEDQTLAGGFVELNGVGFGLSLFPIERSYTEVNGVKNPFRGSLERPDYVEWNLDGIGKRVNFTWSNPTEHKYIGYTMSMGTKVSSDEPRSDPVAASEPATYGGAAANVAHRERSS
jgi:hypothetical protein